MIIANEEAMTEFGAELATRYQHGGRLYFHGELGAGKSTLIRAMLQSLGVTGAIKSPTYTIVEPYTTDYGAAFHFDLYRLNSPAELEDMGFRDYLDDHALILIEWPERAAAVLPPADVTITIHYHPEGRTVELA
jgi:tRNA threonylcarbamoyladenosine biosynthesis protein TsaE